MKTLVSESFEEMKGGILIMIPVILIFISVGNENQWTYSTLR